MSVFPLPPIVLGIHEQQLTTDYALIFPDDYRIRRRDAHVTGIFLCWLLAAVCQSALVYFITKWCFGDLAFANGQHLGTLRIRIDGAHHHSGQHSWRPLSQPKLLDEAHIWIRRDSVSGVLCGWPHIRLKIGLFRRLLVTTHLQCNELSVCETALLICCEVLSGALFHNLVTLGLKKEKGTDKYGIEDCEVDHRGR